MVRDLNIEEIPTKEEIISYEYYRSGSVRVTVSCGKLNDTGEFVLDPSMSPQIYDLVSKDFDDLMAAKGDKPAGKFRVEDLWESIDSMRLRLKVGDVIDETPPSKNGL